MKFIGWISIILCKIRKRVINQRFDSKIDSEILASYV